MQESDMSELKCQQHRQLSKIVQNFIPNKAVAAHR